jgi:hypothetical protein
MVSTLEKYCSIAIVSPGKTDPGALIVASGVEREVGAIGASVLIADKERAALFAIAGGQITNSRGQVDGEVGKPVQAGGEGIQGFLIAAQMTVENSKLG